MSEELNLKWYQKELNNLEQALMILTDDEHVLGQYALGKIEIMNQWGEQNIELAYHWLIDYCNSYVKLYEELTNEI